MPKTARLLPAYLMDGYRGWRALRYERDRPWYARLAVEGQHPRAMVVSCCDSRFDVVALFEAEPGELFVLRNVANLIPPYAPDERHHGSSAAVEFAVSRLGVAHIVVVGHSNCGGVGACLAMCEGRAPELAASDSFIGSWMGLLRPGFERLPDHAEANDRQRALEQEAVLVSLRNLETFPYVRDAVAQGLLSLHGAWFDIGAGRLHAFDPDTRRFVAVEP